ncbi:hypothetical protein [Brachybacterium atlanticum]|uniref:hypothetical protein n=1 Tax=Brachybacterium atlanticum TaxID=2911888 RepID=UPI0021E03A8B|nr:hypothetical protein [Brachybacterium atlanticum]
MKLTDDQREQIADDAATRYRAGESWREIAETYELTPQYVYRLTVARHDITFRRWGQQPIADVDEVVQRRYDGETLDQIADRLGCSRQAVRTALETAQRTAMTRYPRLSECRAPSDDEIVRITELYEACPQAPRNREGARAVRGSKGRLLAEACRAVIDDGVPMQTLSIALGHSTGWVHWLLGCHDLRLEPRPVRTTARRTRSEGDG